LWNGLGKEADEDQARKGAWHGDGAADPTIMDGGQAWRQAGARIEQFKGRRRFGFCQVAHLERRKANQVREAGGKGAQAGIAQFKAHVGDT